MRFVVSRYIFSSQIRISPPPHFRFKFKWRHKEMEKQVACIHKILLISRQRLRTYFSSSSVSISTSTWWGFRCVWYIWVCVCVYNMAGAGCDDNVHIIYISDSRAASVVYYYVRACCKRDHARALSLLVVLPKFRHPSPFYLQMTFLALAARSRNNVLLGKI